MANRILCKGECGQTHAFPSEDIRIVVLKDAQNRGAWFQRHQQNILMGDAAAGRKQKRSSGRDPDGQKTPATESTEPIEGGFGWQQRRRENLAKSIAPRELGPRLVHYARGSKKPYAEKTNLWGDRAPQEN